MRSINPIRESCGDKKMLIKDICTSVTDGSHNPPQGIASSSYLMLSSKNVFDDKITLDEPRFLSEEDFAKENKRTNVKCGDILLTIVGTVGRAAVVSSDLPPFTLQRSVAVLHPKEEVCSSRYLMYALRGKRSYIESHSKGVAQKGIYLKEVAGIDLPVHPKAMQEKITNRLDKLSFIIKCRQQELQKLDDLVRARFVEMFGDPEINSMNLPINPMTEVCEIIDGDRGKNYPTQEEFLNEGYCLFLNAKNVTSNGFLFENCMFVTKEKDETLRKGHLNRGDVVLTTRGTIGNLAFYDESVPYENIRINSGMVILRLNHEMVLERFFIEQFKMQLSSIKEKIASGSAQPQLPISTMNKIAVLIPLVEQQQVFSEFVEQVAKSKAAVQKALDQAQLLFDSLMQEYFG